MESLREIEHIDQVPPARSAPDESREQLLRGGGSADDDTVLLDILPATHRQRLS